MLARYMLNLITFMHSLSGDVAKLLKTVRFTTGAYVYDRSIRGWWRMDMTPVLLSDVPKKLRILLLIMS